MHTIDKSEVFEVILLKSDLLKFPVYELPQGYFFRKYGKGDHRTWVRIHLEAEPFHQINKNLFEKEFGNDEKQISERQYFVCDRTGREVGTATAWFNDDLIGKNYGRIHWVAVSPDHQRKGLAKALTTKLCQRFIELNHNKALVTTENFRRDAINIYLKFGFAPYFRNQKEKIFWENYKSFI